MIFSKLFSKVARSKTRKRRIEKKLLKAQKYFSQNQYELAKNVCEKVLKILADSKVDDFDRKRLIGMAYLGIGHSMRVTNKILEAVEYFETAKDLDVVDDISLNYIFQKLFYNNNFRRLAKLSNRFDTKLVKNRVLMARSYLKLREFNNALSVLQKALSENPDNWEIHYYLGCTHGHLYEYQNALSSFNRAAPICPNQASIFLQRGHAFFKLGQAEKALIDYQNARKNGLVSEDLDIAVASCFLHTKNYKACEDLLNSTKISEKSTIIRGKLFEEQNMFNKAIQIYKIAVDQNILSFNILKKLGLAYLRTNQLEKAEEYLLMALEKVSFTNSSLYYLLGWICFKLNKLGKCLNYWEKAKTNQPKATAFNKQIIEVMYLFAQKLYFDKDYATAIEYFTKCGKQGHSSGLLIKQFIAEAYFRLSQAKLKGDNDTDLITARQYLNHGIKLVPHDTRLKYYAALIDIKNGSIKNAMELLDSINKVEKNNYEYSRQLALCRFLYGEINLAEKELDKLSKQKESGKVAYKASLSLAAIKTENGQWADATSILTKI